MEPRETLQRVFGFSEFRPGQEAAVRHVLNGRNTLVLMPTGAGKSLIYQLAALHLPGTTLVVSPLVALMKDQADGLKRRGIAATEINSTLDSSERARRLRGMADGTYKIVLVAPERFRSQGFLAALARTRVDLLVVDEAHCISEWGHDFRPDYLHLAQARHELGSPTTLALTATATPAVQLDIVRLLGLSKVGRIVTGFNRPNLHFEVRSAADDRAKLDLVRSYLTSTSGAAIVYAGTRRDAEELSEFIREVVGRPARHYHGSLDAATRTAVQDAFLAGDLPVVVATNAFGMGIDRADVRIVLHHTLPGSLEAYYQEAGRAGRDGEPARVTLLYSPADCALQQFFIEHDTLSVDEVRRVHAALEPLRWVRLENLEWSHGLSQLKARLALEYLEAAQLVQRGTDDASGAFEVEVSALDEAVLQSIADQLERRAEHRSRQLGKMVSYAEMDGCRRRAVLEHFGDAGSAAVTPCCDNCQVRDGPAAAGGRQAETREEWATLTVLQTVPQLNWPVGKGKLAGILAGSRAKDLAPFRQSRHFGILSDLGRTRSERLIAKLLHAGHLKQVGSTLPVLRLSPRGQAALTSSVAISFGPSTPSSNTTAAGAPSADPDAAPPKYASAPLDVIDAFLTRARPRPLHGPWLAGWALDFHSRFEGDRNLRTSIGELATRFKYGGEHHLAADLAGRWVALLVEQPALPPARAVVAVPPSVRRESDPVGLLAATLATQLAIPVLGGALVKTRRTDPQKQLDVPAQKQANVAGAFGLAVDVRGKQLILVDDMYDSGATVTEAARVLTRGGAASIIVLTLTKTIHGDG